MAGNRINFEIGFTTNNAGLNQVKRELNEIKSLGSNLDLMGGVEPSRLQSMIKAANDLDHALTSAFDIDLNTVNIQKFNQILKQSGTDLNKIQRGLSEIGIEGQQTFLKATSSLMQFNSATKQTNQFLDNIAKSLGNTIRWSIMSSIVNNISGTIQKSYYYIKDLDSALNDIRIVTGKSADEMSRFAEEANNAAKELAVTTKDYTEGSLIYYQQGLDDETVKTLTDITAKTSNVTGQSMSAVSEQLTAVWNGYQVANEAAQEGMQVYEEYVDKMAAVGASTASDLQELSTAMSKVASAASAMGVGFDDLNAQIATIVSVTRQAPESVGTALKTIYARLGDLKIDGVDEFGVQLGEVSGQLDAIGIHILDTNGQMRDMSDVMAEVAVKWQGWTEAQRQAAAVAMAGKRQYNNLIALFDNWDMYGEALETSMNAAGTLEQQQEIAMDSLANKMDILKATAEDLYDSLYDEEDIKGLITGLTKIVQGLANFADATGGLINLLPMLGSIGLGVFSNQIADSINTVVVNTRNAINENKVLEQNYAELNAMFQNNPLFNGTAATTDIGEQAMVEGLQQVKQYYDEIYRYRNLMNESQQKEAKQILDTIAHVGELKIEIADASHKLDEQKKDWDLIDAEILKSGKNIEQFGSQISKTNSIAATLKSELESKNFNYSDIIPLLDKIKEDLKLSDEEIAKIASGISENHKKTQDWDLAVEATAEHFEKMGKSGGAAYKIAQSMDNLSQSAEKLKNKMVDALNSKQMISNITNVASATGQLITSFNTLKNIGNIWGDENINVGEKILQTLMNLSFALPSIINSMLKLSSVLKIQGGALDLLNGKLVKNKTIREANNAIEAAGLVIQGKVTKASVEQAIVEKAVAEGRAILNGQIITSTAALTAEETAEIAATVATEAETAALAQATVAQEAYNTAVSMNLYIIAAEIIIGVLAAVAIGYSAVQKAQKAAAEQELKSLQEKEKEIETNERLYESYMDLKAAYDNGADNKKELIDTTEKLCNAYDIEISKLDLLGESYDKVTAKINAKRKAQLEEEKENLTSQLDNQEIVALKTSREGTGHKVLGANIYEATFDNFKSGETDKKLQSTLKSSLGDMYDGDRGLSIADYNMENLVEAYRRVIEAQEEYKKATTPEERTKSADYQKMVEWINRVGEQVEAYETLVEKIKDVNVNQTLMNHNFDKIDSLESYRTEVENIANELVELKDENGNLIFNSYEEALTAAKEYSASISEANEKWAIQSKMVENVAKEVEISEDEALNWINNLSEEEREILFSGQVDIDHLKTLDNIKKAISVIQNDIDKEDISVVVSLREKTIKGEKLTKKEKEQMVQEESNLGKDYETAMSDFENESRLDQMDIENGIITDKIESHKKYIETIREEKETELELAKQRQINIQNEIKDLELKHEKFEAGERSCDITEEEKERLEELGNEAETVAEEIVHLNEVLNDSSLMANEVQTTIFDDMIAGIDGVIGKADVLKDLVSVVGENWTIAAGKIEDFAQNFPEILRYQENYNINQEGAIALTEKGKEVMQEQLGIRKQEIIAENEAYQEQLQHQADILYAEADYYDQVAKDLADYLEGQKTGAEIESKLKKDVFDYEKNLIEITGSNYADLHDSIQTNYGLTNSTACMDTEDIFNYWCSVGEAAAAASQAYESGEFDPPTFNQGKHAGKAGTKKYTPKDYGEGKYINQENIDQIVAMQAEAQKKADAARNQADILISKKTAAASATQASINAIDNAASGKGNDKSKSSSGSKEKERTPKEYEKYEADRYWELNKALKAVDRTIKKLQADEKNLYGKAKVKALEKEVKLIKQQEKNYRALYAEQQREAQELRESLSTQGAQFDATTGEIKNYNAAMEAATAQYNAMVDQYNSGAIDDDALKAAKDQLDEFKKDLQRYDKLYYDEIQDTLEKIKDAIRQELSKNLEKMELRYQVALDKRQAEREWNSYITNMKKDFRKVYADLGKEMATLIKNSKTYLGSTGTIHYDTEEIKLVKKEIDKINKGRKSSMFENISQAQEKLKELESRLQEHGEELRQIYEDGWNAYLEQIEQAKEQFEELNKVMDHNKKKMELIHQIQEKTMGIKSYEARSKMNKENYDLTLKTMQINRQEYELNKQMWEQSGAAQKDKSQWNEDEWKYFNNMRDAQEAMWDSVSEAIEIATTQMENSISKIYDDLENTFSNGLGFEDSDLMWEDYEKTADLFYDKVEQGYELQKLSSQITQDMNNKSIKAQEKLKKFQDTEIKALREKDKLSKYELKRAQALYDITLKEIALEEARNNKSAMKLTRNSEGNWSYQYVADEGDTNKAQQDLLDAQMNFRQLAKEQNSNVVKLIRQADSDAYNRATKLFEKYQSQYGEAFLLDKKYSDQYYSDLSKLTANYKEYRNLLMSQLSEAERDLMAGDYAVQQTLWSQLGIDYQKLTDDEIENFKKFSEATLTNFMDLYNAITGEGEGAEGGLQGIKQAAQGVYDSVEEGFNKLKDETINPNTEEIEKKILESYNLISEATKAYEAIVKEACNTAGVSYDNLDKEIKDVKTDTDKAANSAKDLKEKYSKSLPAAKKQVEELRKAWESVLAQIEKVHKALEKYLNMKNKENKAISDANVENGNVAPSPSGNGSSSGNTDNSSKAEGVAAAIKWGSNYGGWGTDPGRSQKLAAKGLSREVVQGYINRNSWTRSWSSSDLSPYYYGAFKTGGYTGDWSGEDGRFAMLHQKELVLNADDTKNFLEATNTLRDLTALDNSVKNSIINSISKMMVGLAANNNLVNGLTTNTQNSSNTNNTFNINAEFPNANDVTEIREAILSLPNLVDQYISRQRI